MKNLYSRIIERLFHRACLYPNSLAVGDIIEITTTQKKKVKLEVTGITFLK